MFNPNDTSTFAPQRTYLYLEHMLQTTPCTFGCTQNCKVILQFFDAKLRKKYIFLYSGTYGNMTN
jgi:hypothetical protein